MHELAITRNIVALVAERARGRKVLKVRLEIGTLSGVMADSIRFCFDAAAEGTPLEGAILEIAEPAGLARCRRCGADFAQETLFSPCGCGARDFERLAGEELNVIAFEIPSDAEPPGLGASAA